MYSTVRHITRRRDITSTDASYADPLSFRPNPSNLTMDRNGSDGEDEQPDDGDDYELNRAGIYRPPRVAAMPYSEGLPKGSFFVPTHSPHFSPSTLFRSPK